MTDDDDLEQAIGALERMRARGAGVDAQIAELRAMQAGMTGAGGAAREATLGDGGEANSAAIVTHGEASNAAAHGSVAAGSIDGSVIVTGNIEGGVYVGPRPRDAREALAAYRKVLVNSTRHLPLRGIDLGAADPSTQQRFDLAAVYVDLQAQPSRIDVRVQPGELRLVQTEQWSLLTPGVLDLVIANRRLVLLGDPGSGKSTFVNHLLLCLAGHGLEPQAGWLERLPGWPTSEADIVPIPVLLRDFARSLPRETTTRAGNPLLLWRFITKRLAESKLDAAEPAIESALESGRAILLLDGLDEIPAAADRGRVRDVVDAFARRFPEARLVATCRTLSYQDPAWQLEGVLSAELAPFNRLRIDRFIDAWYAELRRMGMVRPHEAARLAQALRLAVDRKDLARLAPNPLLLTVMALVHTHKGRLPDARARLYEDTVDLLLWRWDELRVDGAAAGLGLRWLLREASCQDVDLHRTLWQLAYEAHAQGATAGEVLADIGEHRLEVALSHLHPQKSRDWAMRVIEMIKLRAGLLLERAPGVYTFPHRTFQEYLAGASLAARGNFATEASQLDITQWREVILLAVGRLVYVNLEVDRPLLLAHALCGSEPVADEAQGRRLLFAAEVLEEMGLERVQQVPQGAEILLRVRQRLLGLMTGRTIPVPLRIEAGDRLGRVGDPRFDESMWWLPRDEHLGFCETISDSDAMWSRWGSNTVDQLQSWVGDTPELRAELKLALSHRMSMSEVLGRLRALVPSSKRSFIARYPVTVAQYDAYLVDIGRPPSGAPRGVAHHPVVDVTFREALAYCKWLTEKLRANPVHAHIRELLEDGVRLLPCSRVEWFTALCINSWPPALIDDAVSRLRGQVTTAVVGTFSELSTPDGVHDVIGNVAQYVRTRGMFGDSGGFDVLGGHSIGGADSTDAERADGSRNRGGGESEAVTMFRSPWASQTTPSRPVGFRLALTAEEWPEPEDPPPDPTPAELALRRT